MHMSGTVMKVIAVAYVVVTLSSCASTGDLVRCDGRLEPINEPKSRATQTAVPAGGGESDTATVGHE